MIAATEGGAELAYDDDHASFVDDRVLDDPAFSACPLMGSKAQPMHDWVIPKQLEWASTEQQSQKKSKFAFFATAARP